MNKLEVNKITAENYFDEAKYNVTRNLFTFLTILLGVLFVMNFIQGDLNMFSVGFGSLLSGIVLIMLYKTRKFKIAAITAVFLAYGINMSNLFIASNFHNFLDFFWIIIIALYVFFTLGKKWGIFNLYLNIAGVVTIFVCEKLEVITLIPKEFTHFSILNFVINSFFATLVFIYIMLQMIKQTRMAEDKYISANEELSLRNEEKTVMLKEIHHRVKNNLQVITSLLRLQANEVEDLKSKHHFEDSVNRVSAMAMIHEKMYQTESLTQIDLKAYLDDLIEALITSYSGQTRIEISISSNIHNIDPKSLVPLALIFNELVSNSIEHAFIGMTAGQIDIKAESSQDGKVLISYRDNGNWKMPARQSSFGLELIETFTDQLDGTFERTTTSGTKYQFEFDNLI